MILEITYCVTKPFEYNNEYYKKGDEWIPVGTRNDKKLIGRFVVEQRRIIESSPVPVADTSVPSEPKTPKTPATAKRGRGRPRKKQ